MEQEWFEFNKIKKRDFSRSVWIPLRSEQKLINEGEYGCLGDKRELFFAATVAVPVDQCESAKQLKWEDLGFGSSHASYVRDGNYYPSDIFEDKVKKIHGIHLVLDQFFNSVDVFEWHLHQDLVVALGLKREKDIWVKPNEGYIEVARLTRDQKNFPVLLEIKSEFLKDYLCARSMVLVISSFRSRVEVVKEASHINWSNDLVSKEYETEKWIGQVREIHEGGESHGSSMAVFHVSRTDVDPDEDVPTIGLPEDENVISKQWTQEATGKKMFRITGEFWRIEIIDKGELSSRIASDEEPVTFFFITEASGKKESKETLKDSGRWLWFKPELIMSLVHRRGGKLKWHTRDTGSVGCSPDSNVHFGINKIGLVTVYAKDVALLPEWQQQLWVSHNVSPEGGVSEELQDLQIKATPASTQAPEAFFEREIKLLNKVSNEKIDICLFRSHKFIPKLLPKIHRFRAIDPEGLYALAKDIARLTADSIDVSAIQSIVPLSRGKNWSSLKSLEKLLATKIDATEAHSLLGPMVGAYKLRLADAHLPSSKLKDVLKLVRIDENSPTIVQGYQLLDSVVDSLFRIRDVLNKWDK